VSTSKHTPGPWRVGPYSPGHPPSVLAGEGDEARHVAGYRTALGLDDARLIAAAPEMLEALREMLLDADAGQVRMDVVANARALLARVDGETKP